INAVLRCRMRPPCANTRERAHCHRRLWRPARRILTNSAPRARRSAAYATRSIPAGTMISNAANENTRMQRCKVMGVSLVLLLPIDCSLLRAGELGLRLPLWVQRGQEGPPRRRLLLVYGI